VEGSCSLVANPAPPRALPWPEPIPVHPGYVRSPARWYGGKGDKKTYLGRCILAMGGPHRVYVEPFLGGGSTLLAKPRCEVEVVGELDREMFDFWATLRDDLAGILAVLPAVPAVPGYPLKKLVATEDGKKKEVLNPENVPAMDVANAFAAGWLARANEALGRGNLPAAERVAWDFLRNRLSFGGEGVSAYRSTRVRGGLPEALASYATSLDSLRAASARLAGVVILNRDALGVIGEYDSPDALIYCDPPFLNSTLAVPDAYGRKFGEPEQHAALIAVLDGCKGKVLLEGYWSPLYERLLDPARWQRYERVVKVSITAGETKGDRTQCLWVKGASK
jgi:DNA adenine methylase